MAILLASVLAAAPAAAQVSVEVSPLRVELKMGSGATNTQAVRLVNQGREPVRIRARVDDWFLSKDGTPQFKNADAADAYSAASWLRVNPSEQVLAPGAAGTVRFTTTVPAGTVDGGYRSSIMFEFSPGSGDLISRGRDVVFKSRVATLLYVTIGNPPPAVELTDLRAQAGAGQSARVIATLKNSGRVHVRTKGALAIYGDGGKLVRQIEIPNVPVLPESERDVAIATAGENDGPLAPGEYRVEVKIDVGLAELIVGETTMTLAK